MKDRRSRSTVSDLARQASAEPRRSWPQRVLHAALRKWKLRKAPPSRLVMFVGEDAPRDLDDPLSDPKVQARIGEAIAKRSKSRKK
jgi:hypothetical protein